VTRPCFGVRRKKAPQSTFGKRGRLEFSYVPENVSTCGEIRSPSADLWALGSGCASRLETTNEASYDRSNTRLPSRGGKRESVRLIERSFPIPSQVADHAVGIQAVCGTGARCRGVTGIPCRSDLVLGDGAVAGGRPRDLLRVPERACAFLIGRRRHLLCRLVDLVPIPVLTQPRASSYKKSTRPSRGAENVIQQSRM
jgi:hypothetical protein